MAYWVCRETVKIHVQDPILYSKPLHIVYHINYYGFRFHILIFIIMFYSKRKT